MQWNWHSKSNPFSSLSSLSTFAHRRRYLGRAHSTPASLPSCAWWASLWPPPATPPSANALDRSEATGHSPYLRSCPSSPHYLCSFCHFIILFCSLKSHMNQEFYLERCLRCVRIPVHIALNVHWLQIINCLSNADVHLSLYQKSWCSVIALGQNASSEKINQLQAHRAKCVGKIEINPYMQQGIARRRR